MGCGGSKAKKKGDVVDPDDIEEVEIAYKGGSELKKRVHTIIALKTRYQRTMFEKCGIEFYIEQTRDQLSRSSEVVQKAKEEYQSLLNEAMERDADELYRALTSNSKTDKPVLIDVLTARTKWQMSLITEAYERKHHVPLLKIIKENLRTSMGLFTGNTSDLGRLLLLIATDQPERDAQLLHLHANNFEIICEIVNTRSNRELKGALDFYHHNHNKAFTDVMQGKLYQNCGKLMKVILQCKRSESEAPYDAARAKEIAMSLQAALTKKNAEEVIQLLANLSYAQYASVNQAYMSFNKKKEVAQALTVFGGDFYQLLVSRCTGKYHLLCARICEDKDSVTRILGCLTRADCKVLRDCFDVNREIYGGGKTIEEVLRAEIKKESFLRACLNLVSTDTSNFPLGVDRELREDEVLVEDVVKTVEQAAREAYDPERMRELGQEKADDMGVYVDMEKPKMPAPKGREQTELCLVELDEEIQELKGRIRATEEECAHKAELSFAMAGHLRQAQEWLALYETYASQLGSHLQKLEELAEASMMESGRPSLLGAPVFDTIISITDKMKFNKF